MTSLAARGGRVTEKAGSYFPELPTSGIEPEDVDRMSEVDKVREASSEATPLKRNHTPSNATSNLTADGKANSSESASRWRRFLTTSTVCQKGACWNFREGEGRRRILPNKRPLYLKN